MAIGWNSLQDKRILAKMKLLKHTRFINITRKQALKSQFLLDLEQVKKEQIQNSTEISKHFMFHPYWKLFYTDFKSNELNDKLSVHSGDGMIASMARLQGLGFDGKFPSVNPLILKNTVQQQDYAPLLNRVEKALQTLVYNQLLYQGIIFTSTIISIPLLGFKVVPISILTSFACLFDLI